MKPALFLRFAGNPNKKQGPVYAPILINLEHVIDVTLGPDENHTFITTTANMDDGILVKGSFPQVYKAITKQDFPESLLPNLNVPEAAE